ncbi:MAG: helix-turn-helix domain-containing protein [Lachnospiraceae bacterium]
MTSQNTKMTAARWVRQIGVQGAVTSQILSPDSLFCALPTPEGACAGLLLRAAAAGTPTIPDLLRLTLPAFPEERALLLIRVFAGSISCRMGGSSVSLREGELFLISPSSPLLLQLRLVPCTFSLILVSGELLAAYEPLLPLGTPLPLTPERSFFLDALSPLLAGDQTSPLLVHRALTDLLTTCLPESEDPAPSGAGWLLAVHEAIHVRYFQSFSLEQAEQQTGISRYRICRDYKKAYGRPPLQDLLFVRIREAQKKLLTTDLSVQEISSAVGIDNVNHFIELFKKQTGMTPRAFRQSAGSPASR